MLFHHRIDQNAFAGPLQQNATGADFIGPAQKRDAHGITLAHCGSVFNGSAQLGFERGITGV